MIYKCIKYRTEKRERMMSLVVGIGTEKNPSLDSESHERDSKCIIFLYTTHCHIKTNL